MSWGIGDRVGVAVGIGNISSFLSKSIQSRTPQTSLVLDFAGTGTLDSRITFTRSTTGTYYNSSGVLSTAAINAARFDYNPLTKVALGLLVEQSSTNLLTYSADFSNAAWIKVFVTIASSSVVAPDGTNFQKMIESATLTSHAIYRPITVTSGTSYTHSAYAKAAERTFCTVGITDTGVDYTAIANLSTGTILSTTAGSTSTITNVGNGIYRVSLTRTVTAASVNPFIGIYNGSTTYNGDGTSGIYIWGAFLEALAFPTSYIPTTTAQVTRAADNASMTGTNFSSWYNAIQGTVFTEAAGATISGASTIYAISDGTGNNRILSGFGANMLFVGTGGVTQVNISSGSDTANIFAKYAAFFSTNNFGLSRNGATPVTSSSGSIPTVTTLYLGASATGSSAYLNGRIKKFTYYPTALTSAQIQALTT
jgi:hypothetical protein